MAGKPPAPAAKLLRSSGAGVASGHRECAPLAVTFPRVAPLGQPDTDAPARRPEKTQSAIDNPLTYDSEHTPTAVRPAAYNPGTAEPSARVTAPDSSSTVSPPSVIIGHG